MAAIQFALLLFLAVITHHSTHGEYPNPSEEEPDGNPAIQAIANAVRDEFQEKSKMKVTKFVVIKYIISEPTYLAAINIGGDQYCHVKIYRSPPEKPHVIDFQCGKKRSDLLIPF
ncbi:cystatin-A5-like [Engystomops pustulosus]|uniref:cystatin-A5-like n=1 Tax=Engystomops pustulosus TaxID=76066 RepID=UPI003AFA39C3